MGPMTFALLAAALAFTAVGANDGAPPRPTAVARAERTVDDAPARGRVSGVSIAPASGGVEILIAIDSAVGERHFLLPTPARLVIDLGGASLAMAGLGYDGATRGPIRNLRASQYRADTVRLVVDLDAAREFKIVRDGEVLRLTVSGSSVSFPRWESASLASPVAKSATKPAAVASGVNKSSAPITSVAVAAVPKPTAAAPTSAAVAVAESAKQTPPTPTRIAPTQPAPAQPAPTQPAPTQPAPTQPAPTKLAPTQPAPTQAAPTQAAPTQPTPLRTTTASPASAPSASSKGGAIVQAPMPPAPSPSIASIPTAAQSPTTSPASKPMPSQPAPTVAIAGPALKPVATAPATPTRDAKAVAPVSAPLPSTVAVEQTPPSAKTAPAVAAAAPKSITPVVPTVAPVATAPVATAPVVTAPVVTVPVVTVPVVTVPVVTAPVAQVRVQSPAQPPIDTTRKPIAQRAAPKAKPDTPAMVEAASRAAAQSAARADRTPMNSAGVLALTPTVRRASKARLTVSYDSTNIRDVIGVFAAFSGRTIVVGKDVSGTVSADISDKPWDVALQAILQAQGLAATEDASGIITVDSYKNLASNQALEPTVTQIIDVNYAKATVLQKTVQALLTRDCTGLSTMQSGVPVNSGNAGGQSSNNNPASGQGCVVRGSVTADSTTNKLIITEIPARLPEILARLAELDVRTPQVNIKAKIIFVNRTGMQDIGLAYDLGNGNKQFFQQLVPRTDPNTLKPIDTNGDGVPDAIGGGTPFEGPARIALGGNAIAGIANANNAIKPNALNLIYSTALGRYQLTAFLNALQTSSLADVQSEPSITILNNRSAEIFVGQEIPIRVIDASSGGSGGGGGGGGGSGGQPNASAFFPRATVSKEEAGIKLSVTPQITNNRMVLLDIKAENSSAELASTDVGVIFNRQRAESQVLVADGEAAVIGGLTVTETNRYRSGIPILMNLPFVGRLFSQNSKNETKRDLLILVTPHILEDGPPPPPGR